MKSYAKSMIFHINVLILIILFFSAIVQAYNLPAYFENVTVLSGLKEPDHLVFSPDGRMFISERVTGKLLIAKYDALQKSWELNAEPFHVFNVPKPEPRRSGGLKAVVFDPDFAINGFIYAFYMDDASLQNRVVRLKADSDNPDMSDMSFGENGEELLLDLPFNDTFASGSHNGGALEFGTDGKLYISTGDGWTGEYEGYPVQSLTTFTGKILRINPDGSIPDSNPFVDQTIGDYQAIFCLGLRNPYSMTRHPISGNIYINEARGTNKADIYIVEAGANYGHEGSGIGTLRSPWANASIGTDSVLLTGGAWYPEQGAFPATYHGAYFAAMWGDNDEPLGQINYIQSESDTTVNEFETHVGSLGSNGWPIKPVVTRIGPDGNLYYILTTYLTDAGSVQMVRYTTTLTLSTPVFTPNGGNFLTPIEVEIASEPLDAEIRYTLNGEDPTESSELFNSAITISENTIVKAKAFKSGLNDSSVAAVLFSFEDLTVNQPPLVNAGINQTVSIGEVTVLDGSGSTDPDGNDELMYDELWTQISGPSVTILDALEEVAYFTPLAVGTYTFQLEMKDEQGAIGSDTVVYAAIDPDQQSTELFQEDFDSYGIGDDPYDWYDSVENNSMAQDDALFQTLSVGGQIAFGTSSGASNIHSHYVGVGSGLWSDYRFTGRMRIGSSGAGIGVTVLSDYPNRDAYYRIRRFQTNDFHLSPHGTTVAGDTTSGVVPVINTWYKFIVEVEDAGGVTKIRAKLWKETDPEPSSWQIDAWDDSSTRLTMGTVGVWSYRAGAKYWDNFLVLNTAAPVAPTITTQPVDQTVTEGQTATFTVAADGTAPLSYQWYENTTPISGADAASYTTAATTTGDDGDAFYCEVSNTAGSVDSAAATLTVTAAPVAPTITTQPVDQTVTEGQTATFTVAADGTAPLSYQWYENLAPIAGADAASYTTDATTTGDDGDAFYCEVSNAAGSVDSATATLTVTAAPVAPTITTQPVDQTVTEGQTATFTVAADGTAPLSYQWYENTTPISGADAASYTTAATTAGDDGDAFYCEVSNAAGSMDSATATLTVTAAPVAPSITSQPADQTVAEGATATFTVAADGTAPLSYQWYENLAPIAGADAASYTTDATTTGDDGDAFYCEVSNAAGSVDSATATLTVTAAPVAPTITTQPVDQTVTEGQTATFTVAADGTAPLSYQWYENTTPISGADAASYTTAATTAGDDGDAFYCEVSNAAGSVDSAAATLTVTAAPVAPSITSQPADQTVAEGATATFTVAADGTAPLSYQWYENTTPISGADAASYTTAATTAGDDGDAFYCEVSNAAGSVDSATATLTVTDTPPGGENVLLNGDFESGTGSWKFYTNAIGSFTVASDGSANAAVVTTTTVGTNIQLYQYNIPLEPNTDYQLKFSAYSNTGHNFRVSVAKHGAPYTNYGLNRAIADLATGWQSYTFNFTTKNFSNPVSDARLIFWFASDAAPGDQFRIDNVTLATASPTAQCDDNIDNDGDGLIDFGQDPGCDSLADDDETDVPPAAQCADGIDNDGDGLIDFGQDPGCNSLADDDETDVSPAAQCADGIDNDGDGLIDFGQDPGCNSLTDDDETDVPPAAQCADGIDNDGDGLIDFGQDPGCDSLTDDDETDVSPAAQCADGIDNDGDGLIDFGQDPGCDSLTDDDETDVPPAAQCDDTIDNDGDGLIDYPQDPGCDSLTDDDETDPAPAPQCDDTIDNDGDGLIDYPQDPGCDSLTDDDETDPAGGENVLQNGDFESGTGSWKFYTNAIGSFTVASPGDGSANAAVVNTTTVGTNIQLYQYNIPLEPNTDYQLKFSAYSNTGHNLRVSVAKHGAPYTNYGLNRAIADLATGWQSYTFNFTTKNFSNPVSDARLIFWFASDAAPGDQFRIDNVTLAKINP